MKNPLKLFFALSIIFLIGCDSFNGKIIYKPKGTTPRLSNMHRLPQNDTREVFLINTSSDKRLKFTIKRNTKSCPYDSKKTEAEQTWLNSKIDATDLFETLEPGEETVLGWDKYSEGTGPIGFMDVHEYYNYEINYQIVGSREDKE